MSLDRRDFLLASGSVLAGAALVPAADKEKESLPIIDTHQHLWDLDKFTLPWLTPGGAIGRSFVTKDYLAAIEGLNVVKAIYMEVDVKADQHVAEAEYVLALTKDPKNLTVAGVIGGRPAEEGFAKYVKRFEDEPRVIGVRQVLHAGTGPGFCLKKEFVAGVQTLGKHGKTFDLCMRPADLSDAAKLVDACPDTKFILDHCGNGSIAAFQKATRDEKAVEQYRRDIDALAKRDRVICKISGIIAQMAGKEWSAADLAPVINTCLDAFGPDRVIFASDWPVCNTGATLKQWVAALKEIVADRPAADRKKLFHDNAKKFYRV
jgi:L-fuconolactonase